MFVTFPCLVCQDCHRSYFHPFHVISRTFLWKKYNVRQFWKNSWQILAATQGMKNYGLGSERLYSHAWFNALLAMLCSTRRCCSNGGRSGSNELLLLLLLLCSNCKQYHISNQIDRADDKNDENGSNKLLLVWCDCDIILVSRSRSDCINRADNDDDDESGSRTELLIELIRLTMMMMKADHCCWYCCCGVVVM